MLTARIASSTLWQLFSQAVSMVIGLIGIKLVTTALSQSLVGNYQTVYSFLQIFGILADFGLYAVAVRELSAADRPTSTFASIFVLRLIITVLSLSCALAFAWMLPSFADTPLPIGITIALFTPFFTLLAGMLRSLFQVRYAMRSIFLAEVIGKAVPVALIAVTVLLGARHEHSLALYYLYLAFGGIGALALLLASLWFARGYLSGLTGPSLSAMLRIARIASPYGIVFLLTTLYRQSDITLIALLRPLDYDLQNAYYGVTSRLTDIGYLLPTFLLNSALPHMTAERLRGADLSRFYGTILISLLTVGGIFSLVSFFWARPVMLLLTQPEYVSSASGPGADTVLQLLSFSMMLSVIVSFGFYMLLSIHQWRPLVATVSVGAVLSIVLNVLLIPPFGFLGAGMTSIAVHIVLATLLAVMLLRFLPVYLQFVRFVRWMGCMGVLGFLLWWSAPLLITPLHTIVGGVLAALVAIVLVILFRILPFSVLRQR